MCQVVGLAALPLCLSLFQRLPDRGYSLSKPFALIIAGYVFWVLNIMRILPNSTLGIWVVLVLLGLGSGLLLWRRGADIAAFARERWWLIAGAEMLFFLAFVTAAYLRSFVPELDSTEKPMDLMFLNAVTRGEHFPPPDSWLAGENVSYYYFGYLLTSMMTRLSGLETSIGFNLGVAMIVALAATAVFGLVYNLAAPREQRTAESGPGTPAAGFNRGILLRPMVFGATGSLLLVAMGNLTGIFDAFAAHGVGSTGFWEWLDITELGTYAVTPGNESAHWWPDKFWFWWQATRILDGGVGIHEFPFFSFQLGDLHPHVMSIPFVLLAVGCALALLRSDEPLDLVVWLERPLWLAAFAIILGGLAFLNTWDMPTMAFLIALVTVLRNRLVGDRWTWGLFVDSAGFLIPLYLAAMLAYTPFFFGGFTSQASGFTANTNAGSGLFHTLIIWGPFAVIVLPYAIWRITVNGGRISAGAVALAFTPLVAVLIIWLFWDVLAALLGWVPGAGSINDAPRGFADRIGERGWNWLTAVLIGGAAALTGLALMREIAAAKEDGEDALSHVMALALSTTAALLILGVEFVYIQDFFGSRLNTVFKLYYQAWLLLSIAGGFALYELSRGLRLPTERAKDMLRSVAASAAPVQSIHEGAAPAAPAGPKTQDLGGPAAIALGSQELALLVVTTIGAIVGVVLFDQHAMTRLIGAVMIGGVVFVLASYTLLLMRRAVDGWLALALLVGLLALTVALWDAANSTGQVILILLLLLVGAGTIYDVWLGPERPAGAARFDARPSWRSMWVASVVMVLLGAFLYPVFTAYNRTEDFSAPIRSLDGLEVVRRRDAAEYAAIQWLRDLPSQPVVVEALGGDYSEFGRISASTGLPTIVQWTGHQDQWRGSGALYQGRPEDVAAIYTSSSVNELLSIIERYNVEFVYLGDRERQTYPNAQPSADVFEAAFTEGSVIIYRVKPGMLTGVRSE
jgi:YYY domain-containing protein